MTDLSWKTQKGMLTVCIPLVDVWMWINTALMNRHLQLPSTLYIIKITKPGLGQSSLKKSNISNDAYVIHSPKSLEETIKGLLKVYHVRWQCSIWYFYLPVTYFKHWKTLTDRKIPSLQRRRLQTMFIRPY